MSTRLRQRGLSLVELMVGIAISLVIVTAAMLALTHHLRENRQLITETRLMQDLRTATDLISRDLRRTGYWHQAGDGVWHAVAIDVQANPYATLNTTEQAVDFSYSRNATDSHDFAYRLHDSAIEMRIGDGHWQAMTDSGILLVTSFTIVPQTQELLLEGFCSRTCTEGSKTTCPPRQQLRSLALLIEAKAASDALVTRKAQTTVRLRNDALLGACPV
ncbi:MAG: prepilin-type N-terminal cleavage/methylation domain-containing protein [Rhizobacter sp.]